MSTPRNDLPDRPTRCGGAARRGAGVTTTELLVTFFVASMLIGMVSIAVSHTNRAKYAAVCTTNLRGIGLAFMQYAGDNGGSLPSTVNTPAQWEDLLRTYVHRNLFHCPADNELFTSLGSSYDWRDTGDPMTTLAGRSFSQVSRTQISLAFDALPGWHDPARVQVLYLDNTVRLVDQDALLLDLTTPIRNAP